MHRLPYLAGAEQLIDAANDAIESFMLRDQTVIENFVTSDFHLFDQTLSWIEENNLLPGTRFCEFGAGFGVCTMLAAKHGMDAIGIEIEPDLVDEANQLAEEFDCDVEFICGNFLPPGIERYTELIGEADIFKTAEDGDLAEKGHDVSDFDLIYAFPWPGEYAFFEALFEAHAAVGSLLLTYRGREGMHLLRKL